MSKRVFKYSAVIASLLITAVFAGCGTSNKEGNLTLGDVAKVSETACAQCHGSSINSQSGMPIYSEYVQSKHFLNGIGEVVGCQDCHGGGAQHNGVGPLPYDGKDGRLNPDQAGKCFGCHKNAFLGLYNSNGVPTAIQKAHFYNITGAGTHDAMYVTKNFENGCTACHEPHNPLLGKGAAERSAWATSGHGKVSNAPFADEDFKENTNCIRCHTSTGYVNFLTSGWTLPTTTWATAGDNGREVLTCRTCHVNDSFAVRGTTAFRIPYNNGNFPKQLPSIGESNICVACHSGRENEDTIAAVTNFTNATFKNSHYKAGAALMYLSAGFRGFTSLDTVVGSSTYRKTLYPDSTSVPAYGITGGVTSTHRKLGTTAINGDTHNASFFVPGVLDDNGPCVTCHLNANGVADRPAHGHTWKINQDAVAQVCINCHASETTDINGFADQAALDNFLEEQALVSENALGLLQSLLLSKYNISYNPDVYPYFYDENLPLVSGKKQQVKDWTRGRGNNAAGNLFGKRLMGAAFNLQLIVKDPGAFAHARTYVRRLIYDSIDWLDNNALDFSVSATAIAYDPVMYGKGGKAYTTSATVGDVAPGTTESMIYLLGFSRSTGAWNTPERP